MSLQPEFDLEVGGSHVTLRIRYAWWWRWIYWPLTVLAARFHLAVDADRVRDAAMRAIRYEPVKRHKP